MDQEEIICNALEVDGFSSDTEDASDLDEDWLRRAAIEIKEDPSKLESELLELKIYLESDEAFANVPRSDEFLKRFLRAKSHDVDKAKEMMSRYCLSRRKHKENFRNSLPSLCNEVYSHNIQTILQHRDKRARRVFIFRVGNWDPAVVSKEDLFSANYLCLELMAKEERTQVSGIIAIVDLEGLSWSHWMQMSMDYIQSMVGMVQNSFPIRFKEIHIINESPIFTVAFALVKPFLTEKMQNRLKFHGTSLPSLHDSVDASILPEELGGHMGPFSNAQMVSCLNKMERFFIDLQRIGD